MRNILLVEDDEILRETYIAILSTGPYQLDAASNGEEALELCKHTTYDLILLDLMMPIVDGVGFLRRFTPVPESTKIVILSNVSPGEMLEKALQLGADRSVLKADLSPKQLLALVRYEVGGA